MKNQKLISIASVIVFSTLLLSACGKSKPASFSDDSNGPTDVPAYTDKLANVYSVPTQNFKLNSEFKVNYKTYNPDGIGEAMFKAKSIKEVPDSGGNVANEGKKLILVEITIRGKSTNKGSPDSFNQIGNTPSPQFVLVDPSKKMNYTETAYFSDSYTRVKKLFELTKITLDHETWVNTAIVFEVDKAYTPQLALRFTNASGQTEFYGIQQ